MTIPLHIQTELDQIIDELKFNEKPFNEVNASAQALLTKTDYFVKIECEIFKHRKYYVVERSEYDFEGTRATSEAPRYLVEPTSKTTFQTFEL